MFDAIKTVLEGNRVSLEVFNERVDICRKCNYQKNNRCTVCGCAVASQPGILNLATYAEKLPRNGCKHPHRDGKTKGWLR